MRRVLVAALVLLSLLVAPGVAAAENRAGASVVVDPGERVDGLTASGGSVVVYGVVDGNLEAYAGTVVVAENATVTGNVNAYAGSVRIEGTVEGRVVAYGGSVVVSRTGTVRRSLGAAAADVSVAGRVGGDVTVGADTLRLAPTARVGGDVNYDGEVSVADGARVDGEIRRVRDLGIGPAPPSLPPGTFLVYGLLTNLLLGAILLYGGEEFSSDVVEAAALDTLTSLTHGVAAVVVAPLVALGLALTVVGIPLALVWLLALPLFGWVGAVYGRFAVGAWLLSYAEVETPWAGLVAGVVVVGLAGRIPYVGLPVRALVLVLGLGALVVELRSRLGDDSAY
ncbi:MAG: polymer-forming cytoskeletal protein [Haloferacaceae archaeon]